MESLEALANLLVWAISIIVLGAIILSQNSDPPRI